MRKQLLRLIPLCLTFALLNYGCTQNQGAVKQTVKPVPEPAPPIAAKKKQEGKVYKGKVVGKSNKAKTISIKVGKGDKAKTVMVKFDDKTKGIEHAAKGHAAIIAYEMRNGEAYATMIKPKLAKLPPGVTEIKPKEVKALLDKKADFVLIDSRPAKRYAQAHLPGAISIPVPVMKKKGASLLPKDKNKLLIFYCGGPT